MKKDVEEILETLQKSFVGDGGSMKLIAIDADGTVRLKQEEDYNNCLATVWAHRLRTEKAIKEKFPEARIMVELKG
ncbi:MAG: hypothetical protein C0622_07735 [Desulfuromonas sp.]|nr:MAG: hypothetical protein C0622_07735 [Desulfuromonas sp.]